MRWFFSTLLVCASLISSAGYANDLVQTIKKIKSSVVGVGVFDPLAAPRATLQGTGFVIGDGTLVATNYHVVAKKLKKNPKQHRVIFTGTGNTNRTIQAKIVDFNALYDLAILKIDATLPAVELGLDAIVPDGTDIAFTGFPIGAILGLYPATHRGIVSAYTPVITPSINSTKLSVEAIKRLREPYFIYQLDAIAYPGNSGSAVFEPATGKVIAIINKVFVKKTKESALTDPSGITYAVPVIHLKKMLNKYQL